MAHLDENKLLSDRQHAFWKKHSYETQLITDINDWAKILDKGGQVDTFSSTSRKLSTHTKFKLQSTLVISKSKGPSEILRDIRTSTYQMCRTEENTNRTTKFHK